MRACSITTRLVTSANVSARTLSTSTIIRPPRLQNKVAIITGSSSGLGRAIALAYASHGAKLVICADLQAEPRDVGVEIDAGIPTHDLVQQRYGSGRAIFVRTDVGVESHLQECVAEAVEKAGRLDMYVSMSATNHKLILGHVAWSTMPDWVTLPGHR